MTKGAKIFLVISICLFTAAVSLFVSYAAMTAGAKLDAEKLNLAARTVVIYDAEGNRLENASLTSGRANIAVEDLHDYTINAFIASEDREFYSHNGLNYKRILKAMMRNITSLKFKEGASTISQQLIKNTHLSGEKTIKRKLKEIKLTRQLEKKYTKDEILGMYLNTIYFGHNCYGLNSAAKFYFDTEAKDLTLNQSAVIVGLLSSPNNYSPYKNMEKCVKRRNLVLKSMLECNFITEDEYEQNIAMPIEAAGEKRSSACSDYVSMVLEELSETGLDPYDSGTKLNIYTGLNRDIQSEAEKMQCPTDAAIVVRNADGSIAAYRSDIGSARRQIGSAAKPIFVYAPAIEEKKLHLFSKIDDSAVNYGGYCPENYDKKYHGQVTVEDSIKYSYNIPAVKALNMLGTDKAAEYAEKMGILLADDDKNLALALGGMKDGMTLKELTDCYSVFANGGDFTKSHFINEIKNDSGETIYCAPHSKNAVFSKGCCSLINHALKNTALEGTGKKLKNLNFDVAAKTGTCGTAEGNTDAYAVAYTSEKIISVWLGDRANNKLSITGGNDCTKIAEKILSEIYKDNAPPPLDVTSGIKNIQIDRTEYEKNGNILLADDNCPRLNALTVCCLESNLPKVKSNAFSCPSIQKPSILIENNKICIVLCQTQYYEYEVYRSFDGKKSLIYQGDWVEKIEDFPEKGSYLYSVKPYYDDGKNRFYGEEICLPQVNISDAKLTPLPDIIKKDWCNN